MSPKGAFIHTAFPAATVTTTEKPLALFAGPGGESRSGGGTG